MQLVLSNNRVITHGENFLAMGGTVINTVTGAKYENATVAECENCPSDIDEVGYEYKGGVFVPCAPFGVGSGNVAVVCNEDCKAIKDTGIPLNEIGRIIETSYTGTIDTLGYGDNVTLEFPSLPKMMIIHSGSNSSAVSVLFPAFGFGFSFDPDLTITHYANAGVTQKIFSPVTVKSDNTNVIVSDYTICTKGLIYYVTAIL